MKADWRLQDLDKEEKEVYWKENVRVVEGLLGKYGSYLESQGKLGCLNISDATTHAPTSTMFPYEIPRRLQPLPDPLLYCSCLLHGFFL
jgi:hypothetical protein